MPSLIQYSGSVVRYGPNRISINTAEGLREIYGAKAKAQKCTEFYNVFAHFFRSDSTLTTIDAIAHGRKRRVLAQALSGSKIKAMEDHILKHVRIFCNIVGSHTNHSTGKSIIHEWSPPHDISKLTSHLTFDVMGDLAFGYEFDMLKSSGNRYILDLLPDGVHGLNVVS